jgi:adenosylcobinamide-GDP ribazoletransferase
MAERDVFRPFRAAIVFLTRVPVGIGGDEPPPMGAAVPWFPVVGVLLGFVGGIVYAAMWHVSTPAVAAAVAITVLVLVTGAFHLDGLGDVADGFAGGQNSERRLEIMRDSRLGTYGVAAVVLALMTQVLALAGLSPLFGLLALMCAHCLGRSSALWLMATAPPARADGLGIDYLQKRSALGVLGGSLTGVVLTGAIWGLPGIAAVVVVGIAAAVMRRWSRLAIGGISGDVLGAMEQVGETLTLVVLVSFASRASLELWWV